MSATNMKSVEANEEQTLYEWCCLQALLHKAGLLSADRQEKLRELAEGEDEDFFTHYLKEVEKNVDCLRLEVNASNRRGSLSYCGEEIPYEKFGDQVVLNGNRKDYDPEVNALIYDLYPDVTSIQHNSGWYSRGDGQLKPENN